MPILPIHLSHLTKRGRLLLFVHRRRMLLSCNMRTVDCVTVAYNVAVSADSNCISCSSSTQNLLLLGLQVLLYCWACILLRLLIHCFAFTSTGISYLGWVVSRISCWFWLDSLLELLQVFDVFSPPSVVVEDFLTVTVYLANITVWWLNKSNQTLGCIFGNSFRDRSWGWKRCLFGQVPGFFMGRNLRLQRIGWYSKGLHDEISRET